jgi:hypothetical protein
VGGGLTGYAVAQYNGADRDWTLRAMQIGELAGGLFGAFANGWEHGQGDSRHLGGLVGGRTWTGLKVLGYEAGAAALGGGLGYLADGIDGALQGANTARALAGLALSGNKRLQEALFSACFAAGTPLRTPEGSKPVEQFRVGDWILSRSEFEPGGPVVAKRVEEVFVRTGRIWVLRVSGRVIRTTGEHPVHVVEDTKWRPVCELKVGDRLSSDNEVCGVVEEVYDTGAYETVYNLRIADFHTYFVGSQEWGWSVWAHNLYGPEFQRRINELDPNMTENQARSFLAQMRRNGSAPEAAVAMERSLLRRATERLDLPDNDATRATIRRIIQEGLSDSHGQGRLNEADVVRLLQEGQPTMPVQIAAPERPENAVVGRVRYVHDDSNPVAAEVLLDQIHGQLRGFNRVLQDPDPVNGGMAALQRRITDNVENWSTIEPQGRAYALKQRRLFNTPEDQVWLHEPDMRVGGDPISAVTRPGDRRANSVIGGQAERIANSLLGMPQNVNWVEAELFINGVRVEYQR